jgi:hypothetical protein
LQRLEKVITNSTDSFVYMELKKYNQVFVEKIIEAKDTAQLMNNDLDVALLIKSYGTRQDYAFGFPTEKYSLLGAMRKGISNDAFGIFSYRIGSINNDWEKKGITYRV